MNIVSFLFALPETSGLGHTVRKKAFRDSGTGVGWGGTGQEVPTVGA